MKNTIWDLIVKNGNAQEIADKIQKLILSPEMKIEMGRNARKCAEEVFDQESYIQEIKRINNRVKGKISEVRTIFFIKTSI